MVTTPGASPRADRIVDGAARAAETASAGGAQPSADPLAEVLADARAVPAESAVEALPLGARMIADAAAGAAEAVPRVDAVPRPAPATPGAVAAEEAASDEEPQPEAPHAMSPVDAVDVAWGVGAAEIAEPQERSARRERDEGDARDERTHEGPFGAHLVAHREAANEPFASEGPTVPAFAELREAAEARAALPDTSHAAAHRAVVVVGEGDERVVLAVTTRAGDVHVDARTASGRLAEAFASGAAELRVALERHGMALGSLSAQADGGGARPRDASPAPRAPARMSRGVAPAASPEAPATARAADGKVDIVA